jgi:hypothetical protein
MARPIRWLLCTLVVCTSACNNTGDPLPTQPTGITPPAALSPTSTPSALQAGNSGCYTVKFNVALSPLGPDTFEGPMTGDLEGTLRFEFDNDSVAFAGITVAVSGIAHWVITGGVLPGLTFDTAFDNRNLLIDRPGSPDTLFENSGQHRAIGGVVKANLTYRGIFTLVPTAVADHDYHGVICTE